MWEGSWLEQTFHISEIARFFGLPASTLRYWEQAGVLTTHKNPDNHYREYTVSDLMTLSDLIFHKNLGLSLQQIQSVEQSSPRGHEALLRSKVRELEEQQEAIARRMQSLHRHLHAIETLCALQETPFTETTINVDCIVSFELMEIQKLRQYIENPYRYAQVHTAAQPSQARRGLAIPYSQRADFPASQILWENHGNGRYLVCLMKESVHDNYQNDLPDLLKQLGPSHRTGTIISRFLLRATQDGVLYDFYQSFIELLD